MTIFEIGCNSFSKSGKVTINIPSIKGAILVGAEMKRGLIGVYVWKNKAYIPTRARFDSGIWVDTEPVHIAKLNESELISAIKTVMEAGHADFPDPTAEEWRLREDPVLHITKARSWKELAKKGASYSISKNNERIRLDMSKLDKKGRWEIDPQKTRILPPDTPIDHLVSIILEDIRLRPEISDRN